MGGVFAVSLWYVRKNVYNDLSEDVVVEPEALAASWKLVHGDVFRPPPHRIAFCATVGSGTQLFVMAIFVIIVGCFEHYHHRGSVITTGTYVYAFSSIYGGYVSGLWYTRMGGENLGRLVMATALFFPLPSFLAWSLLNHVAIAYQSTAAFPFSYILLIFFLWAFVTLPLTGIGCGLGRIKANRELANANMETPFPCRTNRLERMVPGKTTCTEVTLGSAVLQYFLCGFVPFLSMYVEFHYVFDSVWGTARYTVYGILLLSFFLTLANACLVSTLCLYHLLNCENWRWWWRSLISGFAVAFFIIAYASYFFQNSGMEGLLQLAFYHVYTAVIAYAVGLVFAAVIFQANAHFLWYIYSQIKSD